MGTKPLKSLRGYRASNRGSKRLGALFWYPLPLLGNNLSLAIFDRREIVHLATSVVQALPWG